MAASLKVAWEVICSALSPSYLSISSAVEEERLLEAVDTLKDHKIAHIIEEWFFEVLQQDLRQRVSPAFWGHFSNEGNTLSNLKDPSSINTSKLAGFCEAFDELHGYLTAYFPCFNVVELLRAYIAADGTKTAVKDRAHIAFKAVLFFSPPKHFHETVQEFYTQAFKVFHHTSEEKTDEDEGDESIQCAGCGQEAETCQCQTIMSTFHKINRQLHDLGLLERISSDAVTTIIHQRIKQHVDHTCRGNFETSYLENLENWLETKVVGWLNLVYCYDGEENTSASTIMAYKGRLYHGMYETYAYTRIEQLFNIIIEFPESEPALQDMKECLEKTDLRAHLVRSLKSALETRLLHPGVNTTDILTAYIAAIRALRVLDTTGVILELVCEPVRRYLRSRDDTVRCIVVSLTDAGSSELSDELFKGQPLVLDESYQSEDDGEDWENWMPDPVDADPGKTAKSRRSSDIISMLVNIYGSKGLFVKEYQSLLAERILIHFNHDTEREIRYLELLKLRFGEAELHFCEVMLKDVTDSRRINMHIAEQRKTEEVKDENEIAVNALVVSAQFWPIFSEGKLELPPIMQRSLEKYTKGFEALKGNRTLCWKPHLGMVNLEIEIKEKKLNLSVSPVHATIIMHFQEKEKWTVDELSSVMHMPASALRRKVTYWQSQGLLREESLDTFVLVEDDRAHHQDLIVIEDEEQESAMASQEDQREEELQVFWSYIVGMLTNLESLPLERIHAMLKMFAMQGPTAVECSIPELKAFLDRKVKEQKLLYSSGVYRLPKPGS